MLLNDLGLSHNSKAAALMRGADQKGKRHTYRHAILHAFDLVLNSWTPEKEFLRPHLRANSKR